MSEPPTEYQVGDIANGYIWTGVEWTRYYSVGDVENGYMWTGDAWVLVEDGPAISADDPVSTEPVSTEPVSTEPEIETASVPDVETPLIVGATAAQALPTATSSEFFTGAQPSTDDLSFLDVSNDQSNVQTPIYQRWWFWAATGALALLALGAFALSSRNSHEPTTTPSTSSTSSTSTALPTSSTSGNPTPSSSGSASPSVAPTGTSSSTPEPSPSGTGIALITSRYGTFAPVTVAGTGPSVVNLPAGSDYGMVTATATGTGIFAITELAADNNPNGDLMVDTSAPYSGTTAYGLINVGAKAAKLKIDASGPWRITIAPLDKAPTLALPAQGTSNSVYIYLGAAKNWKIVHTAKASSNFSVVQYAQMPNLLVNAIGNFVGTVPVTAGPTVITIDASGPWTITPAP